MIRNSLLSIAEILPHEENAKLRKVPWKRTNAPAANHLRKMSNASDRPVLTTDSLSHFVSYFVGRFREYKEDKALRIRLHRRLEKSSWRREIYARSWILRAPTEGSVAVR
jgi:hypothetical protein